MPALDTSQSPMTNDLTPRNSKRKRDESLDSIQHTDDTNGTAPHHYPILENVNRVGEGIANICEVLKRYDTTPSILNQSLYTSASANGTIEPAAKRSRLENPAHDANSSILKKAQLGDYKSLDELIHDVEHAAQQVQASYAPSQTDAATPQWKYQSDSLDGDRVTAQIRAFKKALRVFVLQEQSFAKAASPGVKNEPALANGLMKTEDSSSSLPDEALTNDQGKAVMTLYGNAQGQHRQLFSSYQKPLPRQLWSNPQTHPDNLLDALMPLRENGLLGNQIISTKLVPVENRDAVPAAKRELRFRDLFQPPSSLSALTPPKPRSSSTSRGANITWTAADTKSEPSQKHGYTTEKLATGHWLGYDGISTEQESASPEAKRRRRDRALSSGEATREQPALMKAALAKAKEDALFRRVYSTFAPTIDNSNALIPEETRNDMWWNSIAAAYDDPVAIDPALEDGGDGDAERLAPTIDPEEFKDVIDNFEPVDFAEADDTKTSVGPEWILHEIAGLLESLQSYQRVRNSELNGNARGTVNQTSPHHSNITPSEAEVEIYNKSRAKLAELVSRLPPYTVAKVGGDQLADLMLSRDILLETRNYQGTMDDDQATRLAAAAALNPSVGTSSASRTATNNRPGSFTHGRTSSSNLGQGSSVGALRNSATPSKTPLSNWQTPAQSYASSMPRPAYNASNTYGRTPLNSFTNPRPPTGQQPNGVGPGYPQTPGQPLYPQRAQNTPGQYAGYGTTPALPRTTSNMQMQGSYQPIISRPPSNGYTTATSGAPQAPMTAAHIEPRPPTQGSPLPQGSPYAAPQSSLTMNGSAQASRPHTPATPALAQAQQAQQPRQSPSLTHTASQAMTTGSSTGTPVP